MNNMEHLRSTSHTAGAQSAYLESLYESYLKDSSSIPEDWKIYFDSLPQVNGSNEQISHQEVINRFKEDEVNPSVQNIAGETKSNVNQTKVFQVIEAYRNRGHQKANLDPLGLKPIRYTDDLNIEFYGLDSSNLSEVFNIDSFNIGKRSASLSEILKALESIYCQTLGIEYNHISIII